MNAKILLVEDNKEISDNIKEYLELEGFSIDTVFDGEQGIDKALLIKYDLILLDLMLPKIDGISIAKKISRKIDTPIIIITSKDSISEKLVGFESGAVDYIVKPFDLRELEARIKANLKSKNNQIITYKDLEIDLHKREFKKGGEILNITTKEYMIFDYLYTNKDLLLTRTDIIEYVWGGASFTEEDAKLDVNISTLRKKLYKEIIETVKGVGYKINIK